MPHRLSEIINAWLGEIRNAPDKLTPKQFVDLEFTPGEWTAYDVAMIFIGTMNNRTSPVIRGALVKEILLNDPPPPPQPTRSGARLL